MLSVNFHEILNSGRGPVSKWKFVFYRITYFRTRLTHGPILVSAGFVRASVVIGQELPREAVAQTRKIASVVCHQSRFHYEGVIRVVHRHDEIECFTVVF
jgi:hypothetical protein